MRKSTKAALMSVFIMPGAGHLYLKSYIMAAALASVVLASLYVLISQSITITQPIVNAIIRGEVQPEISVIYYLLTNNPIEGNYPLVEFASTGLMVAWVVGIADSYRVGRLQAKSDGAVNLST
ncbi:MAG: hypothetical protein ACJAWL_003061 [Motiliproteus sp.]|jgi:hypothetical protein